MGKISVLCSVAFLLASGAFADVNGSWSGTFSATGSDGSSSSAPGFALAIAYFVFVSRRFVERVSVKQDT